MPHPYAEFVHKVERPARYLGGEYLQVVKAPHDVQARLVLAFPDVYEIGMSHLGTKILYSLLNKHPGIACERAFTPWTDMEEQLRARGLPLVSLETATPLREFDVIGCSLQYELTYTNVLTLLDLGGVPLLAADRTDADPLVLGGGPTATHPEPVAMFFDAFFVGEAEERLPPLLLEWAAMRRAGRGRADALAELASRYPLYVPSLYDTERCPISDLDVVGAPKDPRVPAKVERAMIPDLNAYPFPTDTPVPFAEAVFDRAAIEIARGCTEGCRFCQAGMIYRPVRERSPDAIVKAVMDSVDKAGYDETSLTSLSTADYSCITPLVKEVMGKLRDRKVALSVSSLRAYGLNEELLDEMASVRATGLTFAPEAGTQRMRDVINKNVTEEHIQESADRVFSRGWNRLKLYFMIGLPTETDEDVRGIVETGSRALQIGRKYLGSGADVTVSVSSLVPKPHTPFQWAALDTLEELGRKQRILRDTANMMKPRVKLKTHDRGVSWVEGIMSRGDRRVGRVILAAWKDGARFDGWDECFDLNRWWRALQAEGLEPEPYLRTLPMDGRLPWDHIDIGLKEGFLAWEYRRSVKNRLSHPCGKPLKTLLHHTNVQEAQADKRKLVCYDCGIACDLTQMRDERLVALRTLGALEPSTGPTRPVAKPVRDKKNVPAPEIKQGAGELWRMRFTKLGRSAYTGHLDLLRLVPRIFRRAEIPVIYSMGFNPKPRMVFSPALSLGIPSLGELLDIRIDATLTSEELVERLNEVSPDGLRFLAAAKRKNSDANVLKEINASDFVFRPAGAIPWGPSRAQDAVERFMALETVPVVRGRSPLDLKQFVSSLDVLAGDVASRLCQALDWAAAPALLRARIEMTSLGSVKPSELVTALGLGESTSIGRLGLLRVDGRRVRDPLSGALATPEFADVTNASAPPGVPGGQDYIDAVAVP